MRHENSPAGVVSPEGRIGAIIGIVFVFGLVFTMLIGTAVQEFDIHIPLGIAVAAEK